MSPGAPSNPAVDGPVVATRGLSRRYGRQTALAGIDLEITAGAVYVLVGANGAGKSTTLRLLMNLERRDGGSAEVLGLDPARQGAEVRAQVGYVPEHAAAGYPWMTCARLLRHVAAYYPAWDHEYAEHLSRALEVPLERRAGTLSKGQTRRLQLVLALSHRPPLLLLDEPTEGLDPLVRTRVLTLLSEHIADSPTTVLISTHMLHELEGLADDIGALRKGRLVAQLTRDELRRTVRRYRAEVPEDWRPPADLPAETLRRSSSGREIEWTLRGEEPELTGRLERSGARLRETSTLSLEEAVLAILSGAAP